jgi:hypothetical protein
LPSKEAPQTPDQALAHHLNRAEHHLISAVELFVKLPEAERPKRNEKFVRRLTNAQETVTSLHGEELIHIRGPLRPPRRRKKK